MNIHREEYNRPPDVDVEVEIDPEMLENNLYDFGKKPIHDDDLDQVTVPHPDTLSLLQNKNIHYIQNDKSPKKKFKKSKEPQYWTKYVQAIQEESFQADTSGSYRGDP